MNREMNLSVAEISEQIGLTAKTIRTWLKLGKFEFASQTLGSLNNRKWIIPRIETQNSDFLKDTIVKRLEIARSK